MKSIIRVSCKTGAVITVPEDEIYKNLGGRSLTSHILYEEVDPLADPLGAENKLIVAGMLLGGTTLTTVNRLSIGAKSPLTGGIKESNAGGNFGSLMAAQGIKAIVLEDAPDTVGLRILLVGPDGKVSLEDASDLAGTGNYKAYEIIHQKYGINCGILSIGIAGERLYKNSSINVSEQSIGTPTRAAARGGLGSVMGSKGIKAIVIRKPIQMHKFDYANAEAFKAASTEINQSVINNKSAVSDYGTMSFLAATVPTNIAPYQNYSGAKFSESENEAFNLGAITARIRSFGGGTGHACQPGCIVKCSNIVNDADGNFLTAGFEYETIELFGPNCKVFNIDDLILIDRFCDDFGFDTIEAAVSLGVYMEAGKLAWGDSKGALALFNSFYEGGETADDFGMGTEHLGKKLGSAHIPTVKGQALAAYDPRGLKGTGTSYAISTMGADHTSGSTIRNRALAPDKKEGQLDLSISLQAPMAACDSSLCLFAWGAFLNAGAAAGNVLSAALGEKWSISTLMELGNETLKKEREFNRRAGITADADRLPDFFYTEPNASGALYDITHEEILEKWHAR